MPSLEWLKTAFDYGFDSGDVMSRIPNRRRRYQERKCGGSYRRIFTEAIAPRLRRDSRVLELGPGAGSWTRPILDRVPEGEVWATDYVDLVETLRPRDHNGHLTFLQVDDNSFDGVPNHYFDLFFSFGVLCHNPGDAITEILTNALPKMKPGGVAIHQHGDWEKLERYGWATGGVPTEFKDRPDGEIWWPRNTAARMAAIARQSGWIVDVEDLGLMKRDGLIALRAPA
jgi:SAM-dependent methyltransferase